MKPILRFPEFKGEWEKKRLGNLSSQSMYGIGASAIEFDKENVYVRITDIDEDTRKITGDYTSPDTIDEKYLLEKNDILFARTGASTGKTYIHSKFDQTLKYYFAGFLIRFKVKDNYSSKFIYQYTFTEMYKNWVEVMSVRSGQPGINSEEYSKLPLCIPNKDEQEKIGIFFSKLDQQIELEEKKLELLEQQKRGYMQKIFSQELRFKDDNENEYPEWQLKNLGELGETFTGLSGKTKDDFGYGDGLFITYMNVFKNTIAKSDMVERVKIGSNENQNRVQYGDILFTTSSEVPNEVGMSSIWLFNQDNVYLNSFCFGFRVVVNYIKPVYLARYLRSEEMRKTITILAQGSTRFNISKKEMMKLNIKVPYIEEQIKIDNFFNKIDILILKQGKKIEILKHRKKGLLQKMFV